MRAFRHSLGFRKASVLLLAALAFSPLRPVLACSVTMPAGHAEHAAQPEHAEHAEHHEHSGPVEAAPTSAEHPDPTPADGWPCQDLAHCVAAVLPSGTHAVDADDPVPSLRITRAQQALSSRTPGLEPPPPKS